MGDLGCAEQRPYNKAVSADTASDGSFTAAHDRDTPSDRTLKAALLRDPHTVTMDPARYDAIAVQLRYARILDSDIEEALFQYRPGRFHRPGRFPQSSSFVCNRCKSLSRATDSDRRSYVLQTPLALFPSAAGCKARCSCTIDLGTFELDRNWIRSAKGHKT